MRNEINCIYSPALITKPFKKIMKYPILLLTFSALFTVSSCKKEKCGVCTTTSTTTAPNSPTQTGTSQFDACGDTFEEADGQTTSSTSGFSPYTVTVKTSTKCVEK